MKLKGLENFDVDNTGSNDKDESASFGLIDEGGSDNASDTQVPRVLYYSNNRQATNISSTF